MRFVFVLYFEKNMVVGAIHESPAYATIKLTFVLFRCGCVLNRLPPWGKVAKSLILTDEG